MILRETLENLMNMTTKVPKNIECCHAYNTVSQNNLASGANTLVNLSTAQIDENSMFSAADKGIEVNMAGRYHVDAQVRWVAGAADKRFEVLLYVEGAVMGYGIAHSSYVSGLLTVSTSRLVDCNAEDLITMKARHYDGVGTSDVVAGSNYSTFLSVCAVSSD